MKIGFDATSLCRKITGIEYYAYNLLRNILQYDKNNDYVVFFRKEVHPRLKNFDSRAKFILCPFTNQILCEQVWLPYIASKEKIDLMHFPAFPPGLFFNKKFVCTIHDAAMWNFPEKLSWKGKYYFLPLANHAVKKADKIITVSEFSKKQIESFLVKKKIRIENCGGAIEESFFNLINEGVLSDVRGKLGLPDKFILGVNSLEPRKNIPNLLKAFWKVKNDYKLIEYKLVLVGRKAWGKDFILSEINRLNLQSEVILTGYVDSELLSAIYRLADIFVYPSFYEGFGLPPVEAMASRVPVIASDIPVLREILGDSALFVDPHDPDNIASGILYLLNNSKKKMELIAKGFDRALTYSWQKVASKTINVYEALNVFNRKISLLKAKIDNLYFEDVIKLVCTYIKNREKHYIVTPNLDHLVRLERDAEFQKIYSHASLVLADGVPLLWGAMFLGTPIKEKISGSDLFPRLCEVAAVKGYRLFFLGGREGAALKTAQLLKEKYPAITIVGTYCPEYGFENNEEENAKIISLINNLEPDILFVGLGSPKQEKWIYKYKELYNVPVSIGIGVSFEFYSGIVKRAPKWMQKVGLEWLWRVLMEPTRLWKRYLIDDMQFFRLIINQKFNNVLN